MPDPYSWTGMDTIETLLLHFLLPAFLIGLGLRVAILLFDVAGTFISNRLGPAQPQRSERI